MIAQRSGHVKECCYAFALQVTCGGSAAARDLQGEIWSVFALQDPLKQTQGFKATLGM